MSKTEGWTPTTEPPVRHPGCRVTKAPPVLI